VDSRLRKISITQFSFDIFSSNLEGKRIKHMREPLVRFSVGCCSWNGDNGASKTNKKYPQFLDVSLATLKERGGR